MKHGFYYILGLLALVWGCSSSDTAEFAIEDAPENRVCELVSPDPLGRLMSLYILDEKHFVVNTMDAVSLFGMDGSYIRNIGHAGRAKGEYIMPWCVRGHGSNIVVWDADQLKFIEYALDGTFCAEYHYESAITDFRVDGDMLYIYTAGGRNDHIIDVMDLKTDDLKGLCAASEAHKTSLSSVTGTALNVYDGHLLFAPKDRLEVLTYSTKDSDAVLERSLASDSFKIQEVDNVQDISRSRKSLEAFLNASSRTVYTFRKNKAIFLVALEGTSVRDENNRLSNDGRYYSFYRMDGKKVTPKHYKMSSMGSSSLFADHKGVLYYVTTEVNGMDEKIYLNSLD